MFSRFQRLGPRTFLFSVCVLLSVVSVLLWNNSNAPNQAGSQPEKQVRKQVVQQVQSTVQNEEKVNFENFNNETGVDHFLVPNIVHYVRFNTKSFSFAEYVCILAVYVHQKPENIYFHTNVEEFSGKYWEKIKNVGDLYSRIRIRQVELPSEIFGQKLSEGWRVWHGSDITRIRVMMQYGGIYLDNDMYVVQNLDQYRKFEIAMGWDEDQFLGNQVFIAHKDARLLPLMLDTYHEYHPELWYYNGGERPTVEILYKRPELLHRVKLKFGVHMLLPEVFTRYWKEWRTQDAIHLLMGHRSYLDPHYKEFPDFDENIVQTYNYTFGEMAREVLQHFTT